MLSRFSISYKQKEIKEIYLIDVPRKDSSEGVSFDLFVLYHTKGHRSCSEWRRLLLIGFIVG